MTEQTKSGILLRSAWDTFRADGMGSLIEQTLRYCALYGSPAKVIKYWTARAKGQDEVLAKVQGSLMLLNLKDKGINTDLFINGVREPHATRWTQRILQKDWVVVDIGANVGYYALMEARAGVKKVFAIEPDPTNFKRLLLNIELNGYNNVCPNRLAVGDREGVAGFELAKASNWHRIASSGFGDIEVRMMTLDEFAEKVIYQAVMPRIDYVRMDTEGYEVRILKGMDRVLRKFKPDLFIEVHRDLLKDYGSSQEEVLEMLAGYGYGISKSFILAKEGPTGKLVDLLKDKKTRKVITEKGIASHIFFTARN